MMKLLNFAKNRQGVALIEFAIVFPIMFLLVFGGIELIRYVIIMHKVEKSAYVIADITARFHPATVNPPTGEVAISVDVLREQALPQLHRSMGSFGDDTLEAVVVSSVIMRDGTAWLRWQQSAGGLPGVTSVVSGAAPTNTAGNTCTKAAFTGDTATLVSGMLNGENMIVAEVFYHYRPIVAALGITSDNPYMATYTGGGFSLQPRILSRQVYVHPRNEHLMDLPPAHPVIQDPCE